METIGNNIEYHGKWEDHGGIMSVFKHVVSTYYINTCVDSNNLTATEPWSNG